MGEEKVYPRIRNVDIFPAEVSGQKVICLRDPLNLSGKILFIPYPAFFIISLFDGNHSVVDIQTEFMRRFGELLYREKIQELIEQLDEHYILESDRFREAEQKIIESFKSSPIRPMALAGDSYEKNADSLQKMIESYFGDRDGPGFPPPGKGSRNLVGAIAPHIDYRRGGSCYAWAHRAIGESCEADLFVILGTAHSPMNQPFALTRKHFQTPWGLVEIDQAFLSEVEAQCSQDFYQDEFVHKAEHSIELQLPFLQVLRRGKDPFQMVPILCGTFHQAILENISPMDLPGIAPFIKALKTAMARSEKKVCVLASADLAHIGLRFGDSEPPDRFRLQELAEEDRHLLGYAERLDAEGFYRALARERDRRRVCGLSPIYTLLQLLEGAEGKLLQYRQSTDPGTQSVVTFASVGYFIHK